MLDRIEQRDFGQQVLGNELHALDDVGARREGLVVQRAGNPPLFKRNRAELVE